MHIGNDTLSMNESVLCWIETEKDDVAFLLCKISKNISSGGFETPSSTTSTKMLGGTVIVFNRDCDTLSSNDAVLVSCRD